MERINKGVGEGGKTEMKGKRNSIKKKKKFFHEDCPIKKNTPIISATSHSTMSVSSILFF